MAGGGIDTEVFGDPGSCERAADWLAGLEEAAVSAADDAYTASGTSEAGWEGTAGDAFRWTLRKPTRASDDLAHTCDDIERALRDFAEELQAVQDTMSDIRATAFDGDLTVSAFIIQPPVKPDPPVRTLHGDYAKEVDEYNNGPLVEYNDKVQVFNDCLDETKDAREKEVAAHEALQSEVTASVSKEAIKAVAIEVSDSLLDQQSDKPGIKVARGALKLGPVSFATTAYDQFSDARSTDDYLKAAANTGLITAGGYAGGAIGSIGGPVGSAIGAFIGSAVVTMVVGSPDPDHLKKQQEIVDTAGGN